MDLENIEELFKTEWEKIKTSKNKQGEDGQNRKVGQYREL